MAKLFNRGQPKLCRLDFSTMAEEPDNHTLAYLRRLDGMLDRVIGDLGELKTRAGILEQQYAPLSTRIDRIEDRLDRIERRLDLVGASS